MISAHPEKLLRPNRGVLSIRFIVMIIIYFFLLSFSSIANNEQFFRRAQQNSLRSPPSPPNRRYARNRFSTATVPSNSSHLAVSRIVNAACADSVFFENNSNFQK